MTVWRKPILSKPYRWQRKTKPEKSLRYDTILDGAVRKYKSDGREVCQDNRQGRKEYHDRTLWMCIRQAWKCACCNEGMLQPGINSELTATFDHNPPRGMGAAFREDRIVNELTGEWMNQAAHWKCNGEKGSKRTPRIPEQEPMA